jgi:chromosome segregation protein
VQAAGTDVTEARRGLSDAEQALRLAEADKGHAQRALDNLVQRRSRLEQDRQALGAPEPALLAASQESERDRRGGAGGGAGAPGGAAGRRTGGRGAVARRPRSLAGGPSQPDRDPRPARRAGPVAGQGRQSGEIGEWLKARGLADAKPLWQAIQVEAGWETAVEAVLRERFSALAADADTVRAALASPPPAILTLALAGSAAATPLLADSLRGKVRCDDARWSGVLDEWLAGVAVADDLAAELPLARASACRAPATC